MKQLAPLFLALGATLSGNTFAQSDSQDTTIYVAKSPTCGCCSAWIDRMEDSGFEVKATNFSNADLAKVKQNVGIADEHASCHTSKVGGYYLEGHVPASDIEDLIAEQPDDIEGLAVPGMPLGSPGMEAGGRQQPYETLAISSDGSVDVYAEHNR